MKLYFLSSAKAYKQRFLLSKEGLVDAPYQLCFLSTSLLLGCFMTEEENNLDGKKSERSMPDT